MARWKRGIAIALVLGLAVAGGATAGAETATGTKFAGTIKIGANAELSGFDQIFGSSQVAGMELAIKDINAEGGVKVKGKSYKLKLFAVDNRSDATGVVSAAQELAAEGVLAAAAPNQAFPAGYPIMKEAGIITFGGGSLLALTLTTGLAQNPLLFSIIPSALLVFPRWMPQITGLFPDIKRIAVLIEDDQSTGPLVASIRRGAAAVGWEVTDVVTFPPGTTDFATQLTRIRNSNPDIVFTSRIPIHNIPAMQQGADLDVAPYLWAFTGVPSDLGKLGTFEGKTLVFSQFSPIVGKGATIPALKRGQKKLSRSIKADDDLLPEIMISDYNFMRMLAKAIEKAGTVSDPEAVAAALVGLTYDGPFGSTTMDASHFADHPTSQLIHKDGTSTFFIYRHMSDVEPSEEISIG